MGDSNPPSPKSAVPPAPRSLGEVGPPAAGPELGRGAPSAAPKMQVAPPTAADDMFANIKEAPAAPSSLKRPADINKEETVVETPHQGFKKVIIAIGSIVVFAAALSVGGYWAYNQFLKPKPLSPNLNLNSISAPAPQAQQPAEQQPAPQEAAAPVILDSDNDGLADTEEANLGADPFNPDTDGDRLFDGEEVNVYHTDPLNKDTDGDTFDDGSEVQNGYDPKGPGKLIRIPAGQ